MIINLLKHSARIVKNQKSYFLINIIGLSIGIACSLLIALFIIHELSYDKFNVKEKRIFRLVVTGKAGDQEMNYAYTSAPIGPTMLREFPEVEDFTRLNTKTGVLVQYLDNIFIEDSYAEADSSFFNIFSIPILRGDRKTVLNAPHKLVLSESTTKKIFGDDDPIGRMIKIGGDTVLYDVSGVMADIPETSHFDAKIIASFITNNSEEENNWLSNNYATYILLKSNTEFENVNGKMPELISKYMGPLIKQYMGINFEDFITNNKYKVTLQPLADIHLNPVFKQNTKPSRDPKYLYIFGSIVLMIIIVAAINYMNLFTAQASERAKEVGIKKVNGSSKGMLVSQFLTESVLLSFISLVLALFIIEYSLPFLNDLLGINLRMRYFSVWYTIPLLFLLSLVLGISAGSYPAFFLSSFSPSVVLKGKLRDSFKSGRLRSILVTLQFSISIILIAGTVIIFRQIQYMLNKDLGFNKEQLMVINRAEVIGNKVKTFKDAINNIPEVISVSSSTSIPGHSYSGQSYTMEGRPDEIFDFRINYVDNDFFRTYGIDITSGRNFDESFPSDNDAIIINETTVRELNTTDPLSAVLKFVEDKRTVIGVVKDFHFTSLQNMITPYAFGLKNKNMNYGYISVKLSANATTNTVREIETTWKEFSADNPLQYFFMDQDFATQYVKEKQNAQLSALFSLLTIIIASLGLLGLTSFSIRQRIKEIGILKTYGARVTEIMIMLNKDFLKLVVVAFCVACPVSWYVMHKWLQNFAYRTDLNWWIFGLAGVLALGIALITVSWQTWRAATRNPVDALRYE